MNNCGTCKHWAEVDRDGVGECQGVPKSEEMDSFDENGHYRESPRDWKAKTVDGSGYFSALRTKESFGCVLWEAK